MMNHNYGKQVFQVNRKQKNESNHKKNWVEFGEKIQNSNTDKINGYKKVKNVRNKNKDIVKNDLALSKNIETKLPFSKMTKNKDSLLTFARALLRNQFATANSMVTCNYVNVWESDKTDRTALMYAARYGTRNLVLKLLNMGAPVHVVDIFGETALMHACGPNVKQSDQKIYSLSQNQSYINDWDEKKRTPLMKCAKNGHSKGCRVLLEWKAYPNFKDDRKYTALMYAAEKGHFQCVKEILQFDGEHEAQINLKNINGQTALMRAALYSRKDVLLYLLSRVEVDVFEVDGEGKNAFMNALNFDVQKLMIKAMKKQKDVKDWKKIVLTKMIHNFPEVKLFDAMWKEYARRCENADVLEVD